MIKDVATFDSEGVTIDNLKKVNFVYGGNACGKTTISRVLSSTDLSHEYPQCRVEWDGDPLQVVTFNKDFRERNFIENIPGVFTLGHASVEALDEIKRLSAERERNLKRIGKAVDNIKARESEIEGLKEERQEFLWKTVYKKNEEFKGCLKGFLYKNTFEAKIRDTIQTGLPSEVPSVEELRRRYRVLFSGEGSPTKMTLIPESYDIISSLLEITDNPIWSKPIVGSEDVPIASLIKHLDIADWVRHGQSLLSHDSDVCPFCQKHTIDDSFRRQLEAFFDENYTRSIEQVTKLQKQYSDLRGALKEFFVGVIAHIKSDLSEAVGIDLFVTTTELIMETVDFNLGMMTSKGKEPGLVLTFKDITPSVQTIQQLIDDANRAIQNHNSMVDNLSSERESLKKDIWNYLGSSAESYLKTQEKVISGKEAALSNHRTEESNARAEYVIIDRAIKEKESNVTSVQPAISRINAALKQFGFTGFSIQPSPDNENMYQIKRGDGTWVADTLSEGEKTFIMFLYYMQLVKGSDSQSGINTPRVLVIDDPISSLDSNILFVVSSILKHLLKEVRESTVGHESEIKQVFILTHNVYFHKEVTFINNRQRSRSDTHHWVLFKQNNVSYINSYCTDNPIKGSYELLWKELRERHEEMDNIALQNVIRRIIENYFFVFGGLSSKDFIGDHFSDDPDELAIATSFACWFDEGSHDISDDIFVQHPQILNSKYMTFLKRVFDKLGHMAHYKMMMHEEDSDAEE